VGGGGWFRIPDIYAEVWPTIRRHIYEWNFFEIPKPETEAGAAPLMQIERHVITSPVLVWLIRDDKSRRKLRIKWEKEPPEVHCQS